MYKRQVVGQPNEIVAYVTFDPTTVERRIPRALRLITVKELAATGVRWATDYLAEHTAHGHWGVSFLEIVRMGSFTIDGRAPNWPEHGAAALWCARVAPSDPTSDLGPGRPFLTLEFWMPDSSYVAYMRGKGHYATYGDVKLVRNAQGEQECGSGSSWRLQGAHPLASGVVLRPSVFEFGYDLAGGAYRR